MEMIKVSNYNGDLFSVPKDYNKSISNFNKKPRQSYVQQKDTECQIRLTDSHAEVYPPEICDC